MEVIVNVKDLVEKHASMKNKLEEIFTALRQLKGKSDYHDTELLDNAVKDKRYAVQLLVQEYRRIEADLTGLELRTVTLHDY